MSKDLLIPFGDETHGNPVIGNPLTPEILERLRRLFYDLPPNAVAYCDVVNQEGDRRRIKHHPSSKTGFIVEGLRFCVEIDLADHVSYSGLFILDATLAAITRDSTDEGMERIRSKTAGDALLRLSIG